MHIKSCVATRWDKRRDNIVRSTVPRSHIRIHIQAFLEMDTCDEALSRHELQILSTKIACEPPTLR